MQVGHPVLRQVARELSIEEIRSEFVQQLIKLMKDTMHDAPGVGLAAPQIGQSIQLIVLEDREEEFKKFVLPEQIKNRERSSVPFQVLINPKINIDYSETVEFYEGCLSAAGFVGLVPRALKAKVECLNEKAEPVVINARGWFARILQHEVDHLHGKLCIDHMKLDSLTTIENYNRYWKETAK